MRAIVAWIPMLEGDEPPRDGDRFAGIPQFWDGEQRLGREVARSFGASSWVAWDVYLFYAPGAEWTERGLPPADAAIAQAGGVVVGMNGTLPPLADQSGLPHKLDGRAVVVGAQTDLDALLAKAAETFAAKLSSRR
jgi:hypothetical protein